ncbi:hypothetical protein IV102_17460 [bacterium]|nr:hypothetical protein [bacterium]
MPFQAAFSLDPGALDVKLARLQLEHPRHYVLKLVQSAVPGYGTADASFTNTNVIESTFSVHEGTAHRVKRWIRGPKIQCPGQLSQ